MILYRDMKLTSRFPGSSVLLFSAAIIFNNWLLAILVNRSLLTKGGSVSELSAQGQPHTWLFRALDIVSGLLFMTAAYLLFKRPKNMASWRWLVIVTAVLGLANIVDTLLPLPCAATVVASCSSPIHLSFNHFSIPSHAYSSTIIGICYVILPIAGYSFAAKHRNKLLQTLSAVSLLATLIFFILLFKESSTGSYTGSATAGYSQEIQMIILGVWFWAWAKDPALISGDGEL